MFKRPMDPYKDLDKDELEKRYDEFGEENFSKEEERAMIGAALKTLLPVVIAVCLLFAIFIWFLSNLFLG